LDTINAETEKKEKGVIPPHAPGGFGNIFFKKHTADNDGVDSPRFWGEKVTCPGFGV
jgi:hypothetical protein